MSDGLHLHEGDKRPQRSAREVGVFHRPYSYIPTSKSEQPGPLFGAEGSGVDQPAAAPPAMPVPDAELRLASSEDPADPQGPARLGGSLLGRRARAR